MLTGLFEGYPYWVGPTVAVALALLLAFVLAEIIARLVRAFLLRSTGRGKVDFRDPIVRRPIRLIRRVTFLILGALFAFPALELGGYETAVGVHPENIGQWLFRSGLRIGLIAILTYALIRIVSASVDRLEHDVSAGGDPSAIERAKRVHTIGGLLKNIFGIVAGGAALLMILHELGIDITPLLTGAGIVGLAVGFGAQTLVKDVISGFFMLMEDQVRVGDAAVINGQGGAVEAITLRTIVLRDVEGTVHVFPNGSITSLANKSKDFSYAVLDLSVAYKEDTDRVAEVLTRVADGLRADPEYAPHILEPLEVLGVDGFLESSVTLKVRIKTVPQSQWKVAREFRRRIKKAFDAEGIQIPFPHVSVNFSDAQARGGQAPFSKGQEPDTRDTRVLS
ncbi:MAG: ykuT [Acidobacteria bacterium]|jgi:small conductance mechanosensitive channel|nr:ykuT [Acidobacteriota bacterium]